MITIYKDWLRLGYQNDDPCKFLLQFIDKQEIKVRTVTTLISEIKVSNHPVSTIDDEEHPQYSILNTVNEFRDQIDQHKPSIYMLRSCFCYFSTCMTHVWLDTHDRLIGEESILAYIRPNVPLPYVWLNINENSDLKVELVKHSLDESEFDPLDVIVHVHRGPRIPLVTTKLSIDLLNGEIVSACNGKFMQLTIRLDEHGAYLQSPMKGQQFIVVFTYENLIHGVYHNDGINNRVDACLYCCHYY